MEKSKLKKYLIIISCVLLLLFSVISCYNSKELKDEAKQLQINLEKSKAELKKSKNDFKIVKDSIKKIKIKRNDTIQQLQKEIKNQYVYINSLRDKNNKQKQELVKWNNSNYVNFLKDYYKTQNVVETQSGVELQNDIPKQVVTTIFDKERLELENKSKDTIIENKDKELVQERFKYDEKQFELEKAEEVIFDYDNLNYDQEQLLENQKKNIKFLNIQNKLLKVAIPITVVTTVLTTILIVK